MKGDKDGGYRNGREGASSEILLGKGQQEIRWTWKVKKES